MGFSKDEQSTLVSALDKQQKGAVTFTDLTELIGGTRTCIGTMRVKSQSCMFLAAVDDGTGHDPMLKASELELDGFRKRAEVKYTPLSL